MKRRSEKAVFSWGAAAVILTEAVLLSGTVVAAGLQPLAVFAEETEDPAAAETAETAGTVAAVNSGTTVVPSQDEDFAVTAFEDGIYIIEGGEAVRVFEAEMEDDAVIATDGMTVWFTDRSGMLCSGRIGSGEYEKLFGTEGLDPAGIAGNTVFLLSGDTTDAETGILDSFGYVALADLTDGSETARYEGFDAECCDGYTVLFERALDASPRQLYIFDRNGEPAVDIPDAITYSFDRGILYVGSFRYGPDGAGSSEIRRFIPDGTGLSEEIVENASVSGGGRVYGLVMGGYLALVLGEENCYVDMRTGTVYGADSMEAGGEVWTAGFTAGGSDYVCSSGSIARLDDGDPHRIFDLSGTGIMNGAMLYADGQLLIDGYDGQFYVIPLQESDVTALDLYSSIELYEAEAAGHKVYHCIPHISTDHPYTYEALNDRLGEQTAVWEEISDDNTGIGVDAAGPGSTEVIYSFINAYIARSDSSVLSIEQFELVQREGAEDDYRMVRGVNLNTRTGEDLTVGDVVSDIGALREAVAAEAQSFFGIDAGRAAEYAAGMFPDGEEDRGTAEYSFSVGYEGLAFYFAAGIMEEGTYYSKLLIPYAKYPSMFTELVLNVPLSYAYDVRLTTAEPYTMQDSFRVFCALHPEEADSAWAYDRLLVISEEDLVRGRDLEEVPVFPLECGWVYGRVMHTADGRDFLYLLMDGAQPGTGVYALDGEPSFAGHTSLAFSGTAISEYSEWFADPEKFGLFEDTDKGLKVRCFRTGEDGMPECLEVTGTDAVLYGTEKPEAGDAAEPAAQGSIRYAQARERIDSEEEEVFAEYSAILLDEQTKTEYPELAGMVDELNAYQEKYYQDEYEYIKDAEESAGAGGETYPLYSTNRYYIRRADACAFSILEYCEYSDPETMGFAWYSYNIDPADGSLLQLSDVIADTDRLWEMMAESVTEVLQGTDTQAFLDKLHTLLDGSGSSGLAWTVDPMGVTLFIAPPAGQFEFGVPIEISLLYEEQPEMFTDWFRLAEDGFSMELIAGDYVFADLGSDGTMDEISVLWDETGTLNGSFMISVNDSTMEDNLGVEGIRCWYVRTADGNDLVAAASDMGDGVTEYLDFYTLEDGMEWAGGLAGRFDADSVMAEEDGQLLYSLCDPGDFGIRFRTDVLGTMYLSGRAYLEGKGELYPFDERLRAETFDGGTWIVRQPFRVRTLNAETLVPGISAVLPEGTVLRPAYTDGVSYIDCTIVEDGTDAGAGGESDGSGILYRLEMETDASGTMVMIEGTIAEELLDGIEYAQ